MHNLLAFFVKHSPWLVFVLYFVFGCVLLFRNNPYQQHVYLTSANAVSATVYEGFSGVTSYFHLKQINEDLQKNNASLENEVLNLRTQLADLRLQADTTLSTPEVEQYGYILARVIGNSLTLPYNYITINRGRADGVEPDMGVVDQNGIVGIVDVVGEHASRVISLLNMNFLLSCKVKGKDFFGSLVWAGRSSEYALLKEMPRHVKYAPGDTVITSGFSQMFPEGIMVGQIAGVDEGNVEDFLSLRVRLSTDFSQLSTVRAIRNSLQPEIRALEEAEGNQKEVKP